MTAITRDEQLISFIATWITSSKFFSSLPWFRYREPEAGDSDDEDDDEEGQEVDYGDEDDWYFIVHLMWFCPELCLQYQSPLVQCPVLHFLPLMILRLSRTYETFFI